MKKNGHKALLKKEGKEDFSWTILDIEKQNKLGILYLLNVVNCKKDNTDLLNYLNVLECKSFIYLTDMDKQTDTDTSPHTKSIKQASHSTLSESSIQLPITIVKKKSFNKKLIGFISSHMSGCIFVIVLKTFTTRAACHWSVHWCVKIELDCYCF